MSRKAAAGGLVSLSHTLPATLPLVPVSQTTLFPGMVVPFVLPEGKLVETLESAEDGQGCVGIILSRNPNDGAVAAGPATSLTGLPADGDPGIAGTASPFYRYGVAAKVLKRINLPDNQVSILVTGLRRFLLRRLLAREPHFVAGVEYLDEVVEKGTELEALLRNCLAQFKTLSRDNPLISEEVKVALVNIDGPGKLADFMASVLLRDVGDYQDLLAEPSVRARLHHLLLLLKKEQDVQAVQKKIQDDINQKVSSAQREFYLHEQLKLIQKELGRAPDERTRITDKFRARLEGREIPLEARRRIDEEIEKLGSLPEQSSEYSVALNYLEWATTVPWGVRSEESRDLRRAKRVLDADHYGLKDVKARVLEFLAVKKLRGAGDGKANEGSILCFVGPPGTGKTSLGRSIARALRRKFFRFSVGGMRDEAEIKGHRRTYVGAMPGKFVQGLKRAGVQNPVFLIDEIDKIGTGWHTGGDPASALLELLDPEQNAEFLDHYLDIPFDASEVLFITTANTVDTIPPALLDRLEVIPLHGYTDGEKAEIARRHVIPKQLRKHGLAVRDLTIADGGLKALIERYARESGVRNLEKNIARLCRKVAYRVATGRRSRVPVRGEADLTKFLGQPPFTPEKWGPAARATGVATGLAWTQHGGEILFVESLAVPGKGGLVLTGTLGKVMQESANIAYTLLRSRASEGLGVPKSYFDRHVLHVHVPAGATPKDGPSAGVTIVASLYSLLSGERVDPGTAMTGEITLTGRIMPVGGIQEKLLAARRSGVRRILIPKDNEKDLKEIDRDVKTGFTFLPVATVDEALGRLFPK